MKSQTDWIVTSVSLVLALIIALVLFLMKREPVQPQPPTQVVTSNPTYPTGDVVYSNALPSPKDSNGGAGGPAVQAGGGGAAGGGAAGGRSRPSLGVSGG